MPEAAVNYVLGYGSLIDRASRLATTPRAFAAYPVIVDHLARGWWSHGRPIGFSTCFLGATADPDARCNGVLYPVSDVDLEETDRRESIYSRTAVSPEQLTFLDGRKALASDATVWYYAITDPASAGAEAPSARFPIVQSYIDVCLNGCFEIEALYPLAAEAEFARMFLTETRDWGPYWVNDRPFPRRPASSTPRAIQIDALLHEVMPDLFAQIELESAVRGATTAPRQEVSHGPATHFGHRTTRSMTS
jgi:cation transport regulator ChaC